MRSYPKIDYYNRGLFDQYCYAFDKLDGSNCRAEWSKKRGWYKFGSRNVMIDKNTTELGQSIDLFLNKYADGLEKVFKEKDYRNSDIYTVFFEFVGENSFAGKHDPNDIKDVVLFDVCQYKKGFVAPKPFIENFGHLGIPNIIYRGIYNYDFINDVRNNIYNLKEGVICKGTFKSKSGDQIWQVKVKTNEWLSKIKSIYGAKYLELELNNDKELIKETL